MRIWQSDTLVDEPTRERLLHCVAKLEDVPEKLKDWHPQSDGQVLDLVHPSLYPVVYDRTLTTSDISLNVEQPARDIPLPQYPVDEVEEDPREKDPNYYDPFMAPCSFYGIPKILSIYDLPIEGQFVSSQFQWLPTDFLIPPAGDSAHALGYINNLDPLVHQEAYKVIEEVVTRFVPLWERVLGESAAGYLPHKRCKETYSRVCLDTITYQEGS